MADSEPLSPRSWRAWMWRCGTVLLLGLAPTCLVFVDETELAVVERLGRIVAVYDRPEDHGLHFKAPWPVETVRRFDRRLQMFSPPGREVFTRDRKNIVVDAYVCWRIAETPPGGDVAPLERPVVRFFRGLGTAAVAEARLASRLQSILTTTIGQAPLAELLSAAGSEDGPAAEPGPLARLSTTLRQELAQQSADAAATRSGWGIEIVDVRIRRLNLPAGNQQAVFERMRSERQKIAERYRSAGLAESTLIRSQADRQAAEILARAQTEAERIRAAGEAEALHVLNAAQARDPEFAQRLQALDAYRELLNEKTTLILSADSPLWRLLIDGLPGPVAPPPSPPSAAETTGAAASERSVTGDRR